jgi:hypothetical protein
MGVLLRLQGLLNELRQIKRQQEEMAKTNPTKAAVQKCLILSDVED